MRIWAVIRRHANRPWLLSIAIHMLAGLLLVPLAEQANVYFRASLFTDVSATHPHERAISWLEEQGYVRGHPDGSFAPDDTINRAEFVRLLINTVGFKSRAKSCLDEFRQAYGKRARFLRDIEPDAWYEADVCVALEQGIVTGYGDKTFRASNPVSFAEAAVMLTRAYGIPQVATDPGSEWYKPATLALSGKSAIPDDVVSFTASVSRAIVAEMIYRIATGTTNLTSQSFDGLETQSTLHAAAPSLEDPASELVALINATRWQYGLPAVRTNDALTAAALTYADDMRTRGYFSHTGPDGSTPPDRIKAAGYQMTTLENCGCSGIEYTYGEVLANALSPDKALEGFLNSPVHRSIVLSKDLDEVGVGVSGNIYVADFGQVLLSY